MGHSGVHNPDPGSNACVVLLFNSLSSLKVPLFNVVLALLPTLSIMLLLKVLDTAIETSQPEVSRSTRAVFKQRMRDAGTARRRKKRGCWESVRSMLRRVMLPQYYSIARLVTMFDFLMVIWLLIAAQPTELWFKLLTVLLRFAYGTIEMMIPVVLCATALHYTDNPRRIEFDLKTAQLVAATLSGTEMLVQLILLGTSPEFVPEAVLITCTPNADVINDDSIFGLAKAGGSLTFWTFRDSVDLLYFAFFLFHYYARNRRRTAALAQEDEPPVASTLNGGDSLYGSSAAAPSSPSVSNSQRLLATTRQVRAATTVSRWSCAFAPHPRPALLGYAGFLVLIRGLRVLACLIGLAAGAHSCYLCVFAVAYFLENGLLPGVAYLSLTYDSDYCRHRQFGDGAMQWKAGARVVSEQDYTAVVLLEKLHSAGSRTLWEGVWNGASVAVKRWRYPSKHDHSSAAEQRRSQVATEIRLMRTLVHPNVVQFLCYCVDVPVDKHGRVVPRSQDMLEAPLYRDAHAQRLSSAASARARGAPDVAAMPAEHDAIPEHGRLDAGNRESWSRSRQARSVGSLRRPLAQDSALPASPRLRLSAASRGGDAVVVMQDVASDGGAASVGVAAGASPSPRAGFNPGSSAGAGAGGSADAIGRQPSGLSIRTSLGHEVSTEGEFKLSLSTGSRLSAASKGHSNTSSGEFHKAYASVTGPKARKGREVWIVMELLDNLNLHRIIKAQPALFDVPRTVISVAMQLCSACLYLRHNEILHRDIKSPNILVRQTTAGAINIKLADFDTAVRLPPDAVLTEGNEEQLKGTYTWMAPEVFFEHSYSEKSDVFSFGIVLYELLMHRVPYHQLRLRKYKDFSYLFMPPTNLYLKYLKVTHGPPKLRTLVQRCTHPDPVSRPTFSDIRAVLAQAMSGAVPSVAPTPRSTVSAP